MSLNDIIDSGWQSYLHILLIITAWSRLNFLPHSLSLPFSLGDSLRSESFLLLVLFSLHFGNQFLVLNFFLHRLPALLQGLLTGLQSSYSCSVLLRLSSLWLRLGRGRIVRHALACSRLCLRLLFGLLFLFKGFGSSFSKHTSMFTFFICGLVGSRALGLPLI